jgi:hypothetical protein
MTRPPAAVDVSTPASVTVPVAARATFDVTLTIHASDLPAWPMNSGGSGASPASLTAAEFDCYIWLDDRSTGADDEERLHLPWQVRLGPAADLDLSADTVAPNGTVDIANPSANDAGVEVYSLLATSDDDPDSGPGDNLADVDFRAIGVQTFPVGGDFGCNDEGLDSFVLASRGQHVGTARPTRSPRRSSSGISTRTATAMSTMPCSNADLGGLGTLADGRNVTFVLDVAAGQKRASSSPPTTARTARTPCCCCAANRSA